MAINKKLENLIKKALQFQFYTLRQKSVGPKISWHHFSNPRKVGKTFFQLIARISDIRES